MTSTGTFKGLADGRNSSKVLKPPGGGSSDIFGATCEVDSPRRSKQSSTVNQSQLGSTFFDNDKQVTTNGNAISPTESNFNSAPVNINKPGNDSYKRLFGPPEALPKPAKNYSRSNVTLSNDNLSTDTNLSPRRPSTANSHTNTIIPNGNGHIHNDVIGGNPVTGTGYAGGDQLGSSPTQNGSVTGSTGSAGSEKSSTDSSPSVPSVNRFRNRIPPGGYSSGLW